MKEEYKKELQLEIRARKELIKRLDFPKKQLSKVVEKERIAREKREKHLLSYVSLDDAREAYGYGDITMEEFDQIQEAFENADAVIHGAVTANDIAYGLLRDFLYRINSDVSSLEFELKSPEEQERIRMESDLRQERIQKKREMKG